MKEHSVEAYLKQQVEARGGLCEKFTSPGRRGVPDRLVTWRDGGMQLVELKRPKGGRFSAAQKLDHRNRAQRGVRVFCLFNLEQVDEYVHVECPDRAAAPIEPFWLK